MSARKAKAGPGLLPRMMPTTPVRAMPSWILVHGRSRAGRLATKAAVSWQSKASSGAAVEVAAPSLMSRRRPDAVDDGQMDSSARLGEGVRKS
jgi:hypothetical protein